MDRRIPAGILALLFFVAAHGQSRLDAGLQSGLASGATSFEALAELKDTACMESFLNRGIPCTPLSGNIISLKATREQMLWLKDNACILRMEGGVFVKPSSVLDEASNTASQVHALQRNPFGNGITMPYTGKDVVIGIIDIGFQPDHPTFFDTLGNQHRVVRYWDQLDETGNPPAGYPYGSLHSTSDDMVQTVYTDELHGTHVAGIAGGSGFGSKNREFAGVAYEAELVFVNIRYYNDSLAPSAKGDLVVANPSILDGVKYIFQYADSVGKPAVVNLSWGMQTGPHDGTSLFDKVIEQLSGDGKIFVGAGGNNGWGRNHITKIFTGGDTLKTMPYNNENVRGDVEDMFINLWGAAATDFSLRFGLADTNGQVMGYTSWYDSDNDAVYADSLFVPADGGGVDTLAFHLSMIHRYAGNNKPYVIMELYNLHPQTRRVTLEVISASGSIHAWNSGQINTWGDGGFSAAFWGHSGLPGYTSGDPLFVVGENGGTGKATLTAGAYNASETRESLGGITFYGGWGNRSQFSSRGPTVDGRTKPDISAPGENVISAYNRHAWNPGLMDEIIDTFRWNNRTEYWGEASGTSMAAPNTTGVVALMLQADPTLDVAQVRSILQQTAITDEETGEVPNNEWGYGKINAYAAVFHTQEALSSRKPDQLPELRVYPNPSGGVFTVWGTEADAKYVLFDLSGKKMQEGQLEQGVLHCMLSPGTYLLLVRENGLSRTVRVQIMP